MAYPLEHALHTYTKTEVETGVAAASPQRLIVMLYDGALKAIYSAKIEMSRGNVSGKGAALSKAIAIIEEGLRGSLNLDVGGDIARNLDLLYEYIANRLLLANLKNDVDSLDEAARLLSDLRAAWEVLDQPAQRAPSNAIPEKRAALSYGRA